jgi:hypothetical protein
MTTQFRTFICSALLIAAAGSFASQAQEQLPWQNKGASPRMNVGANDSYRAPDDTYGGGSSGQSTRANDAYAPPQGGNDNYNAPGDGSYESDRNGARRGDSYSSQPPAGDRGGYGEPYSPPPQTYEDAQRGGPAEDPRRSEGFEQGEVISAGHRFFGSVSGGIANAVEYLFKSQGRPNGYILGQDAGGALVVGLRYGEGTLYTKDAGDHRVFWQGPSVGYDAGGDGSKTMILVYNLRDPGEIYERFGGVQGAAYVVGGVSVQFQKYNDVTLAVIRSGVGLRLGANVGYMKYTRSPTWNPL